MIKRDLSDHGDDQASPDGEPTDGKSVDEDGASPKASWNQSKVFRFVGLGTELAGFTLVFAGLGYLIDRIGQNPKPYGTALGALDRIQFGDGAIHSAG